MGTKSNLFRFGQLNFTFTFLNVKIHAANEKKILKITEMFKKIVNTFNIELRTSICSFC